MPSAKGPAIKMPGAPKAMRPTTKIHPSAQMRVRLPQGSVSTPGDPGVSAPDIGKF